MWLNKSRENRAGGIQTVSYRVCKAWPQLEALLFSKDQQAARLQGTQPDYRATHVMTLLYQSRAREEVPLESPACLSAAPHMKGRQ